MICREDGIRTHDAVTHILAFQASSFNHSDTSLFGAAKNYKKIEEKKRFLAYSISPRKEVSKIVLKTDGDTF
jgi:hypothetical protein